MFIQDDLMSVLSDEKLNEREITEIAVKRIISLSVNDAVK